MTIRDIARKAGVSSSTVSRVLNADRSVKEETRARVLRTMEQSGYVPNSNARNLKLAQSQMIGVLIKGIDNPFFIDIVKIIQHHISQAGYSMIFEQVDSGEDELAHAIRLQKERRLRGVFFLGGSFEHPKAMYGQLTIPYVYVTASPQPENPAEFSSVAIDDEREAYKATNYLCGLGHQRILVISSSRVSRYVNRRRIAGIKNAMHAHGLVFDEALLVTADGYALSSGYDAANLALDRGLSFTCCFALTDTLAIGAARAFHDRGLGIPRDISVMGFDGIDLTRYCQPSITTLKQPSRQMAQTAVELMIDLNAGRCPHIHRVFGGELRIGESCALASTNVHNGESR